MPFAGARGVSKDARGEQIAVTVDTARLQRGTDRFDLRYPDEVQGQELREGLDGHPSVSVVERDELWWLEDDRCTP